MMNRNRITSVCLALGGVALVTQLAIGQPLQGGDAEMDLDYDQCDWVQVLAAAKYLTGEPATWGEGDFDGAPGGAPGSDAV